MKMAYDPLFFPRRRLGLGLRTIDMLAPVPRRLDGPVIDPRVYTGKDALNRFCP